jgi:hypothetical protein
VAAHKDIETKAIVGDCLLNQIKQGRLQYDVIRFVLPYILYDLINTSCSDITNTQLLVSRYNDLIRTCKPASQTASTSVPTNIILVETGDYTLLETGDYILLE